MKNLNLKRTLPTKTLMLLAAIGLIISLAACTVTPKIVRDTTPSFDGSVQNSGFLGFTTNNGAVFSVITPNAKLRYDGLVKAYGSRFNPPLTDDTGLTPYTNGTWLIDAEHDVKARQMNQWRRQEAVP